MSVLRLISLCLLSILAPTGIISNIIVLISFFKQRERNNCSHIFFMHLAAVDLLLCTGGLITGLGVYQVGGFLFCKGGLVFIALFYGLSSGTLCLMTLDRLIYISMPLRYYSKMTVQRARLLITGIWSLSIISVFPVVTGAAFHRSRGPYYLLDIKNCVLPKIINIPYFFWLEGMFLIFLVATVCFNFRILSHARQQSMKIDTLNMPSENTTINGGGVLHKVNSHGVANMSFGGTLGESMQSNRTSFWRKSAKIRFANIFVKGRQRKYVKTIACVVLIHCICNLPYFLFVTSEILCGSCFEYKKIKFAYSLYLLNYLNSVLNPVIYTSLNSNLRKSAKKLLCSICCRS